MCQILHLTIIAERSFYSIQANYLFPVVHETWAEHQQDIFARLSGQQLKLAGDGRCHSPGFNAKYCTYTMMSQKNIEIVDFNLVQVTETSSSVAMVKESFKHCMTDLNAAELTVFVIATDRHIGIASLCRKEYQHITHQFDIWHVTKGIVKKLTKAAKTKDATMDLFNM